MISRGLGVSAPDDAGVCVCVCAEGYKGFSPYQLAELIQTSADTYSCGGKV